MKLNALILRPSVLLGRYAIPGESVTLEFNVPVASVHFHPLGVAGDIDNNKVNTAQDVDGCYCRVPAHVNLVSPRRQKGVRFLSRDRHTSKDRDTE